MSRALKDSHFELKLELDFDSGSVCCRWSDYGVNTQFPKKRKNSKAEKSKKAKTLIISTGNP